MDDSPWDDDAGEVMNRESEWTRISSEFTTAGYREGITAGKESALQGGFDSGFANVGAPLGREIGTLRGIANTLISHIASSGTEDHEALLAEARDIASGLTSIRLSDIAPRDIEAEEHAKQHLEDDDPAGESEELADQRKMEKLEDMLSSLNATTENNQTDKQRPTIEDFNALKTRLANLCQQLHLAIL